MNPLTCAFAGAGDRTRTGDPHLGKVMLYQLSHAREAVIIGPAAARASSPSPPSRKKKYQIATPTIIRMMINHSIHDDPPELRLRRPRP